MTHLTRLLLEGRYDLTQYLSPEDFQEVQFLLNRLRSIGLTVKLDRDYENWTGDICIKYLLRFNIRDTPQLKWRDVQSSCNKIMSQFGLEEETDWNIKSYTGRYQQVSPDTSDPTSDPRYVRIFFTWRN